VQILQTPIEYLKGVGPNRGALLRNELQIHTYQDLLHLFPNRYIDRTKYYQINELVDSQSDIQIIGKIIHLKVVEQKRGKRLVATFTDGTGTMELVWFQHYKWIQESLQINIPYVAFGKITKFGSVFNMAHPDLELLEEHQKSIRGAMQAVYPSTEKLAKKNITSKAIQKLVQQIFIETSGNFEETLPNDFLNEMKMISKKEAMLYIHFPKSQETLAQARYRLKLEELFFIQLLLISKNLIRKHKIKGLPFEQVGNYFQDFYHHHLPFQLTNAQKKVVKEIRNDLGSGAQMNRLLQGDVGSGKTMVAFLIMLLAKDNQYQSCLMAPTEILAQQHFSSLQPLAASVGLQIALLTGSTKNKERAEIHQALQEGTLDILIGTHAIIEDTVQFKNLGLAIVDEQHRFGVKQRAKLWKKNHIPPHVLVMTATPIPRTLAMSLYGDLDISVIDELPPGRKPIQTFHRTDAHRLAVWKFLKDEIAKGRQVYIVYPLIQESEKLDLKDLMDGYESISRDFPLPHYAVSIVHGKMKPQDKDAEMQRFAKGETNIMVATTVIEVGVNVPNASVMVIENAERFGLSQLHQLRGRVGRGADQSYCILMTSHALSEEAKTRLETMCRTNDGFEIAEVDLKLRGPGDIMGTQQSGILQLQIADLVKDRDLLPIARNMAFQILKKDPSLQLPEHQTLKKVFIEMSQKKNIWNFIS
jgi:ATP-dependent DNA helicase RecG